MTPDQIRDNAIADAESTLRELGEEPNNSRAVLDMYGDAIAALAILQVAWEVEGSPVYAVGSRGQLQTHPTVKSIADQQAHIAGLARALNLTPESRTKRRVGGPMGQTAAKDRRGVTAIRKAA